MHYRVYLYQENFISSKHMHKYMYILYFSNFKGHIVISSFFMSLCQIESNSDPKSQDNDSQAPPFSLKLSPDIPEVMTFHRHHRPIIFSVFWSPASHLPNP